jgi:hypothetical protein
MLIDKGSDRNKNRKPKAMTEKVKEMEGSKSARSSPRKRGRKGGEDD